MHQTCTSQCNIQFLWYLFYLQYHIYLTEPAMPHLNWWHKASLMNITKVLLDEFLFVNIMMLQLLKNNRTVHYVHSTTCCYWDCVMWDTPGHHKWSKMFIHATNEQGIWGIVTFQWPRLGCLNEDYNVCLNPALHGVWRAEQKIAILETVLWHKKF